MVVDFIVSPSGAPLSLIEAVRSASITRIVRASAVSRIRSASESPVLWPLARGSPFCPSSAVYSLPPSKGLPWRADLPIHPHAAISQAAPFAGRPRAIRKMRRDRASAAPAGAESALQWPALRGLVQKWGSGCEEPKPRGDWSIRAGRRPAEHSPPYEVVWIILCCAWGVGIREREGRGCAAPSWGGLRPRPQPPLSDSPPQRAAAAERCQGGKSKSSRLSSLERPAETRKTSCRRRAVGFCSWRHALLARSLLRFWLPPSSQSYQISSSSLPIPGQGKI